jgi:RNA polymerase sigma-70 factor (ECF subfamily)
LSERFPVDPDTDLESLMARYQRGEPAAAAVLVHRLSPQLLGFFLMQVSSRPYAEDLLQETWLRIHQVRHTYRPGAQVLPWLYAIARNVRVDHYRKASRGVLREQSLTAEPAAMTIEDESRAIPDLETILAALPDSQREVIAMLKVSGMSLEEVARATQSSVGSVKQKAHRAYEKLRGRLSNMGFRDAGKRAPI